MKYIELFEKYTENDIDKKYYVFKMPYMKGFDKIAVIEICSDYFIKDKIYYNAIRRTDFRGKDFFTGQESDKDNINYITLEKWNELKDNILFETDNRQDAWDFLSIYITYKDANRDNWEMYRDSEKYNIV